MSEIQNCEISFAIHDLNPWGGQDRATLEIAKRISHKIPVHLYSFTYAGIDENEWGSFKMHKLSPNISRPVIVKYNLYYLKTLLPFLRRKGLVQTTGTTSLLSDIVQVQFVQAAWEENKNTLEHKVPFGLRSIYHWGLSWYKVTLEHLVYGKDKYYIAISNSIRAELIRHFKIPEENIFVAHHGVDADHFHPFAESTEGIETRETIRSELGIFDDEFAFVLVGALNERKGVKESIESLAQLPKELREKSVLMVLGKGDAPFYQGIAEKLGVSDRVRIVSHKSDIRPYYWAADGFVLPSHYEPFGLVILEAMSCGLPVVVSKSAGASELVKDGVSGLLIERPTDIQEISKHMVELLQDRKRCDEMGKAARQVALTQSWDHVSEKYIDVIERRWQMNPS